MKVLYVRRNLWNNELSWWKNRYLINKRYSKFKDQDGYLRGSLHRHFAVNEVDLSFLESKWHEPRRYDYLVVNYRADSSGNGDLFDEEFTRSNRFSQIPAALFIGGDGEALMPSDKLLNQFDLVLKRQPYTDLDRYKLSAANKDKIRPTTLGCPLVPATTSNIRRIRTSDYGFADPAPACTDDVFFSGQANSQTRVQAWTHLATSSLNCHGGLQRDDTHDILPPDTLAAPKIKKPDFIKAMRNAAVNLALDGHEAFTYRHIETWCLACLSMCSPTRRELSLPFIAEEDIHYVCYDNLDDLVDKIRFYADHNDARQTIASAGRSLFEKYYSFDYHGAQLHHWLDNLGDTSLTPPSKGRSC